MSASAGLAASGAARRLPTGEAPRWRFASAALALPLAAYFVAFLVLPVALLVIVALSADLSMQGFTLVNVARFFEDNLSLPILGRTLLLGIESALLALLLGYPIALVFCAAPPRLQKLLIVLIVLPLLTSAVVRTFAWVVILGRQGVVNETLRGLGILDRPIALLYTEPGLTVAMAQIELPLMALPLISALSAIDPRLKEASRALGVGPWTTLARVTLPLSLPGAIAGLQLVFAAACSALITQSIVGGGRLIFAPLYIYQQGIQAQNWPFAATMSIMLLAAVLCIVGLINGLGRLLTARIHV